MPLQQQFDPATIHVGIVHEDGGATVMARLYAWSGSALSQSATTSITAKVFDLYSDTPTTAVVSTTLTVSAVIFDALQTDARWTLDTTGFNFLHAIPATYFPTGGHLYQVEYKITPATGEVFWLKRKFRALKTFT